MGETGARVTVAETVLPVLAVEPGHVAEARRALHAQGRAVDDAVVERLLWVARALPAALDVLADTRSPIALGDACISGAAVELLEPTARPGAPLLLFACATDTGVRVEVVELFPWLDTDECRLRCRVTLTVSPVPPKDGVRVVRFQVG